ncbi:sulfite exporter TauE/SafE family protein [Companilactobacillus jidongensis]|uniref:sulfite exporter TauE/SafE family protein n=1 Tax=Companilactobacillus jidongensis TaxID=2486006 RepID=UPI0017859344|nr:sulfite exporter TauE/SafE family protein [Companilactobacillus jidongensis]
MPWLFVLIPGMLAGLVQGLTGFGPAIVLMVFLPSILPMAKAAGVAGIIPVASVVMMAIHYRHYIKFKRIIWPFILYAVVASLSIHLGGLLDVHISRAMLGGLLIILSLYFLFSKSGGQKQFRLYVAISFVLISGFFSGLFGIGGPLMALYFLSLSSTKEEYMATVQMFFVLDMSYTSSFRIINGIIGIHEIPIILIGIVGAIIGTFIASRILNHMNLALVSKCIYTFIGMSGLYYLITSLLVFI